jgi:flagellar operon protein
MTIPISGNRFPLNDAIIKQSEKMIKRTTEENPIKKSKDSFQEILNQEINQSITFSKHAAIRKTQRNIEISSSSLEKISNACDLAREKGMDSALIVMDDSAFIVNAVEKRVVTVIEKNEMKNKIVNNIDGAVFI